MAAPKQRNLQGIGRYSQLFPSRVQGKLSKSILEFARTSTIVTDSDTISISTDESDADPIASKEVNLTSDSESDVEETPTAANSEDNIFEHKSKRGAFETSVSNSDDDRMVIDPIDTMANPNTSHTSVDTDEPTYVDDIFTSNNTKMTTAATTHTSASTYPMVVDSTEAQTCTA